MKERPTQERLKEVFHYDPETGVFVRKKPSKHQDGDRKYGKVGAGRVSELGYVMLMLDGTNYIAGQLVWLYETGAWPPARIKYIDGDKLNNRFSNISVPDKTREQIKAQELNQARLKELLHYEPETGHFTWRVSSAVAAIGSRAGGYHSLGYRTIGVDYKKHLEHVLAWVWMTGERPDADIDHINGDKADNRWCNLREATRTQNNHNQRIRVNNKSGATGVRRSGNKFQAYLHIDGEFISLGRHDTVEEAAKVRAEAKQRLLGAFGKPGAPE